MRTIADQFEDYRKNVMSKDAPPIQVKECKLAFYAGGAAFFHLLNSIPQDSSVDTGAKMLEWWRVECDNFLKNEVKNGL